MDGRGLKLPTVAPAKVTDEEVEQAASALGLTTINTKTISAQRILGSHLSEIGAAAVARGIFIVNVDQIQKMMGRIDGIMDDLPHEPGVQAKMAGVFAQLSKNLNEAARGLMEAGDPKPNSQMQRPPIGAPPPGQVLIQVNGGNVKVKDEMVQEGGDATPPLHG